MAKDIIESALAKGRDYLYEDEAKEMLAQWGISVNSCKAAFTPEEADLLAGEAGYPVALKVRSGAALHKSDLGGVHLDLPGPREVLRAFDNILSRIKPLDPDAGVTVQPMASPGVEVIVGFASDKQFGKVLMFGLGGVFAEVLEDVGFRLCPLDQAQALALIKSIKGYKLLEGYRGAPPLDIMALSQIITRVSQLAVLKPQILELDLNPVVVYPQGALALDARAKLDITGCSP